ncbi:PDDEXK family nuclease [Nitrincola tapanii]|uniref:DUF1887 family protein n=1 Tax=Nitrincola tapanii TaxID=1708751 RepID=A0A5A9W3Z0_9GAMM|nr:hypothetical protein [Nitrincola tapanii]KAA0874798.1 hypothetical protein E1H14_08270 [Nitrincola tapanii]
MNPITYICIASEFNVPELEACLAVQPSDLVLIVSNFEKACQGARRLASTVERAIPGIRVHRPDEREPFDGEDILAVQHWVRTTLIPYLAQHISANNQQILNFTGGTKALSLALITNLNCRYLHYKGMGKSRIQVLQQDGQQLLSGSGDIEPVTATPLQVAQLYAGDVKIGTGLRGQEELTSALANDIWRALKEEDAGLLQLFNALDRIWSEGRGTAAFSDSSLAFSLDELLQGQVPESTLVGWLNRFAQLNTHYFCLQQNRIIIPGNGARKQGKYLRRWISGEWLEELAVNWLQQGGMPAAHIARGVIADSQASNLSESGRETDLFVHHRGRSYLVEIKADLPHDANMRSAEHQLASLGDRFGKTQKVLFIGPQLQHKLIEDQRWHLIEARFSGSGILLAFDRSSLLRAFGLAAESGV